MKIATKILVLRNDKLGDFMLAWPAFSLLKQQYPELKITALVPRYTVPLAEQCVWIDEILIDEKQPSFFKDITTLANKIRCNQYDASISLFSEARTSLALSLARVRTRVGPATKIAQIFLNMRLKQKRSQSLKPEYEYNLDLIRYFISSNGDTPVPLQSPPFLFFDSNEIAKLKNDYLRKHSIPSGSKLVFIHPGTGGSAVNLSLKQYADLVLTIAKQTNTYFIITAGPGETKYAESLSELTKTIDHHIHYSTDGIVAFSKFINICDVFVSGSTGPLHIAGALNVCTVAFYPARLSATSLRWRTINTEDCSLVISPKNYIDESDMQKIDVTQSAQLIIKKFFS